MREDLSMETVAAACAGDRRAVETVLERMEPIIGAQAWKRHESMNIPVEDLMAAGALGVLEALQGFDPERGTRFETYSWGFIRHAMGQEMESWTVGMSIPKWAVVRSPELLGDETAQAVLSAFSTFSVEALGTEQEDGSWEPFDIPDVGDVESDVITRVLVEGLLDLLDDVEREIVVLYFGLGDQDPMDDLQISAIVDRPRSTVNRLRRKALDKMREGK